MEKHNQEKPQQQTHLAETISKTDQEAQYDAACKMLISEKPVLARILKETTKEFEGSTLEDIENKYIEGTPQIAEIPLLPDEQMPLIEGINGEFATLTEGTTLFDVLFQARAPETYELVGLYINIEAQNDFHPGYPIVTRGVFHCGRLISKQYGSVFKGDQYGKLKKVISIWICLNPPKYRQNTVARYELQEEMLVGESTEKKKNYDLISVVMICLGDPTNTKTSGILRLLNVLLTNKVTADEKNHIMEDEFQIKMTENMKGKVSQMCNLSQGIKQEGIREGIIALIQSLAKFGIPKATIHQEVMEKYNLSSEEATDYLNNYYHP